jgi:thiamine biosynthesis lipoprotein
MSTEAPRLALNGATMGTRWQATFRAPRGLDAARLRAELQAAVDEVDAQMSTWRPQSDLMRLNAAAAGEWVDVPAGLHAVLCLGLAVGRASGGAFDLGQGDAVAAWGFGPAAPSAAAIRRAVAAPRPPAHEVLEIGPRRVRKRAAIALDLNGIAKGYGVDRLAATLKAHGIADALVGIDGEMRALGLRPDGRPWVVAVEAPEAGRRAVHSVLELRDAAVASSGEYRQRITWRGRQVSHIIDPRRGVPLAAPPASVSVVAGTCAEADAWATALMVLGPDRGGAVARKRGLDALFLLRDDAGGTRAAGIGPLFAAAPPAAIAAAEGTPAR